MVRLCGARMAPTSSSCAFAQVRCRNMLEKGWSADIIASGQGEHNRTSVLGWLGYLILFLYPVYFLYEMYKVEDMSLFISPHTP